MYVTLNIDVSMLIVNYIYGDIMRFVKTRQTCDMCGETCECSVMYDNEKSIAYYECCHVYILQNNHAAVVYSYKHNEIVYGK